MPPLAVSERQPDKNLTFTQFFTKLLIKFPQVDIEKLPAHLLKDITYLDIPCQGQPNVDKEQYKEEKEEDIYSLEHQENIEEFKPKETPDKFIKPVKRKNSQSEDSNQLKLILTEPEDEDADSITCTVEESDLNCPQEEMLDLTITDEFTEECGREAVLSDPIEDHEEISMADIIASEEADKTDEAKEECFVTGGCTSPNVDKDGEEPLTILEKLDSTDVCEKIASNSEAVNDLGICQEDDIAVNEAEDTNEVDTIQKINELKEEEDIKTEIELLKSDTVPDFNSKSNVVNKSSEETSQLEKSDSDRNSVTETCVGPKGGNNKDNIATAKLKHVEEQSDSDPDTVSSEIDLKHFRSPDIESNKCIKETSELNENNVENELNDRDSFKDQPVSSDIQEVNQKIEIICDSPVKEINQVDEKMNETNKAETIKLIPQGVQEKTKLKGSKNTDKKFAKGFNIEEDLEPPALKIRIFKGHSGELINEKEAKRTKKRKKKTEKQKAKLAKLSIQKAEKVKSIAIVEKNTQNRLSQELPGCNWLEQKIKSGEGSQNIQRPAFTQLDALLETDSDDDYLVVDDQDESCEVTTNFKEDDQEKNYNDDNATKTRSENQDNLLFSDPVSVDPTASGKDLQESDEKSVVIEEKSDNEVPGSHPFTYMLGNLMKKMDTKHTDSDTNQNQCNTSDELTEENRQREENKIENKNKQSIGEEIKIVKNIRKPEEIKKIPHFKRQEERSEYRQPIEEAKAQLCEHSGKKFKPNPVERPNQTVFEQQPRDLAMNSNPRTVDEERHDSYEKTIEESRVARQNAQNLFFQQQLMEKKRIEDQLIKDIEDLKNKKIKEMEDLIEIKTKKEQTMTDLEKLKSEIVKNKTFLESLKKINLREETQVSSPSAARFEEVKHIENKSPANPVQQYQDNNTKSPEPRYRAPQIQEVLEKRLPDLVNHEKTVFNENNVHTKVSPEHLRHLNLSQDYLKHLQRIQENGNTSFEHPKYAERTPPPPQLYNKQVHVNQNKVATIPENQINHQAYASNNLRPPSLPNNIPGQNQQQQVPMLLPNAATKLNKYGTNIHNFFPGLASERNPNEPNSQRLQQPSSRPISISKVQSDVQSRQTEARGNVEEIKTVPNKVVVEGFIRPRAFSREENMTSPTELSKLMNNMNSQYAVRNNIPNIINQSRSLPTNQNRQEIPVNNRNFPEIRNAIAASTDRRIPQPQVRTPTPTSPQSSQPREPASILSKCAVCSKVANFLCSGCQKVYYCTVQCQSNHWLSHYSKCVAARS